MFNYNIKIFVIITALSVSEVVAAASMIPLGLGVKEGSMTILLVSIGINPIHAISIAILQRILVMLSGILLGYSSIIYLGLKGFRISTDDIRKFNDNTSEN